MVPALQPRLKSLRKSFRRRTPKRQPRSPRLLKCWSRHRRS
jgi:hypothetical protein